jgi:uncharacterized OB-fold protein
MSDATQAETTLAGEWAAGLDRGELLIQVCGSCSKPNMYPRYRCPFCGSDELSFEPSGGVGVLHSYTVVRLVPPADFVNDLPYSLGVVKLDEGVQLTVRLEPDADGSWDAYACDVRVRFAPEHDRQGRSVAWFKLEPQG